MIERQAGHLRVTVPMVMANARGLLDAGRSAFKESRETVDLAAVGEVDSSSVAVLLGWLRAAEGSGIHLAFANAPASLRSLADLYGVTELLPLA